MRRILSTLMLAGVAGCAALESGAPKPVQYACDNDRRFSVAYHPGGEFATLELDGMQFALRREPSSSGAKYGCDVLTLWTKGPEVMIDMQGSKAYSNCRAVNP